MGKGKNPVQPLTAESPGNQGKNGLAPLPARPGIAADVALKFFGNSLNPKWFLVYLDPQLPLFLGSIPNNFRMVIFICAGQLKLKATSVLRGVSGSPILVFEDTTLYMFMLKNLPMFWLVRVYHCYL